MDQNISEYATKITGLIEQLGAKLKDEDFLLRQLESVLWKARFDHEKLQRSVVFPGHGQEVVLGEDRTMNAIPHSARLETLRGGDAVRFVVEVDVCFANALRARHNLPIVPAPLDASDAMVRATHEMAGALIELQKFLAHERSRK
jgi:hypothetical protein